MFAVNLAGSAELLATGLVVAEPAAHALSTRRPVSSVRPASHQENLLASSVPTSRDLMLGAVPSLRAFAISLCRNADRADDLVQETLLRALSHIDSFQPGTNMSAWLFTILRNHFRSEYRKRRREVEDIDGSFVETLESQPNPTSRTGCRRSPRPRLDRFGSPRSWHNGRTFRRDSLRTRWPVHDRLGALFSLGSGQYIPPAHR